MGTLSGLVAIACWSAMALFTTKLRNIPTFEILAIALAISGLSGVIWLAVRKKWHTLKQPISIWLIGILGIFINDTAYIFAFKSIAPVQAELINYTWPFFIVIFSAIVMREKLCPKHFVGMAIGFGGIAFLLNDAFTYTTIDGRFCFGCFMALAAALSWSTYSVFKKWKGNVPLEMTAAHCTVGAVLSLCFHITIEETVIPTWSEFGLLATIGLTTSGLAYYCWDAGMRNGNLKLLSVFSYAIPVLSIVILALFGEVEMTSEVWISSLAIFVGALISLGRISKIDLSQIQIRLFRLVMPIWVQSSMTHQVKVQLREEC